MMTSTTIRFLVVTMAFCLPTAASAAHCWLAPVVV
jgi:hypothetical protein